MAKKKNNRNRREQHATVTTEETVTSGGSWHAARETIESIVIAFVLAFLFRTFEAEAFVIPTGSMSPSLQGQHKDIDCTECGYRFRTTASSEGEERAGLIARLSDPRLNLGQRQRVREEIAGLDVVAGMCPMCRQTIAFRDDLPPGAPSYIDRERIDDAPSYPGDRILVNKYSYLYNDPERWDVVVFKFPGNGEMNYIKRLVGLPNETVRVYQGDVFTRPDGADAEFRIERKPAGKVAVMLQEVHDSAYEPTLLHNSGWPLRWEVETPGDWQIVAEPKKMTVSQQFRIDAKNEKEAVAWLRYRHRVPKEMDWAIARQFAEKGTHSGISKEQWLSEIRPGLIRDFNPYNTRRLRRDVVREGWPMTERMQGLHWVGDLAVECEVEIDEARGELLLDLVEAGNHFICRLDLYSGEATIQGAGETGNGAKAKTPVDAPGSYRIRFANVDDQLLLWVDDELVHFGESKPGVLYDADQVFGDRKNAIPTTNESDLGDLAPVRVGAHNAALTVHRLKVLRDIYYVATSWQDQQNFSDYPRGKLTLHEGDTLASLDNFRTLFTNPKQWPRFLRRQKRDFTVDQGQYFVMGDNSPESQDSRLWAAPHRHTGTYPGGPYLDKRLLTGKAVCVFWPHSWGSIPGASKLPGFPNFGDMRVVR